MNEGKRKSYPKMADIRRMIEAARASGVVVGSVMVGPDGVIVVSEAPRHQPALQGSFDHWEAAGRL